MKHTVRYWLVLSLCLFAPTADAQEKEHSPAVQAIFDTMLSHFQARGMKDNFNPLTDDVKFDLVMETPWSPPLIERRIFYRVGIKEFSHSDQATAAYSAQIQDREKRRRGDAEYGVIKRSKAVSPPKHNPNADVDDWTLTSDRKYFLFWHDLDHVCTSGMASSGWDIGPTPSLEGKTIFFHSSSFYITALRDTTVLRMEAEYRFEGMDSGLQKALSPGSPFYHKEVETVLAMFMGRPIDLSQAQSHAELTVTPSVKKVQADGKSTATLTLQVLQNNEQGQAWNKTLTIRGDTVHPK